MVHIPHVALRGIHRDTQLGIEGHQLLHGGTHREHAAVNGGAAGIDGGIAGKHLGEVFHHALGDMAVLLLAQSSEVAPASFRVLDDDAQLVEHVLSEGCQLAQAVGLGKYAIGDVVALAVAEVA